MLWFDDRDIAMVFIGKRPVKLYFVHKNALVNRIYAKIQEDKRRIYAKKLPEKVADMLKTHTGKL